MKKATYKGKDVYWNEDRKCWCYMNHRAIPKNALIDGPTDSGSLSFTTKLVNFFKGE